MSIANLSRVFFSRVLSRADARTTIPHPDLKFFGKQVATTDPALDPRTAPNLRTPVRPRAEIIGIEHYVDGGRGGSRQADDSSAVAFEIQDLMSRYQQAETLASHVAKKSDDARPNDIIGKI